MNATVLIFQHIVSQINKDTTLHRFDGKITTAEEILTIGKDSIILQNANENTILHTEDSNPLSWRERDAQDHTENRTPRREHTRLIR